MPARNTALKPDANGRYRPYLGWKLGEDGQRRQHRFNLGSDRKEAERRMARLRELWAENETAAGEPTWTPFALSCANQIAEGTSRLQPSLTVKQFRVRLIPDTLSPRQGKRTGQSPR